MRKVAFLVTVAAALLLLPNVVSAQQGDATLGFGTLLAPGASGCTFNAITGIPSCPEKGGLYPTIGADVIFHKRFGVGFDVSWRGSQGNYAGLGIPYRPILLAFNGVYQPRLGKRAGLDLLGGIGWQTSRFYSPNYTCSFYSCTNFSSNHNFLVDLGVGVRYYVWGHVFVRPEARYYWVNNNSAVTSNGFGFNSSNLLRVGASIGYTIGPE